MYTKKSYFHYLQHNKKAETLKGWFYSMDAFTDSLLKVYTGLKGWSYVDRSCGQLVRWSFLGRHTRNYQGCFDIAGHILLCC